MGNTKDRKEEIGRTLWMINHANKADLEELLGRAGKQESVGDILYKKLEERKMSVEVMAELAAISRAGGYKILNDKQRPGQDTLLRIAFVLELDPNETQRLLKAGRCALLTAERKRDVAVIYGLSNRLSLGEMDGLLLECGFAALVPPAK